MVMHRSILASATLLLISLVGSNNWHMIQAQSTQTDTQVHEVRNDKWERDRICRSKIRSQTEKWYRYEFGKPTKNGQVSRVTSYDRKGRIAEIIPHHDLEGIDFIVRFDYDRNDRVVQEKTFYRATENYPENPRANFPHIDKYDSRGVLIERQIRVVKIVYGYNEFGDRILETIYSPNGKVDHKIMYEYDKAGRLIVSRGTNRPRSGVRISRSQYFYDDRESLTERIDYNSEGDPLYLRKYTYGYYK